MKCHCVFPLLLVLVQGCSPAPDAVGASVSTGGVVISGAVAWGLASAASSTIGFRVICEQPDTLQGVSSPNGTPMMHTDGPQGMTMVSAIPCEAGTPLMLGGGAYHIMVTQAQHGFKPGDSVVVDLQWARAGTLHLVVPMVRYSEAQTLLAK